MSGLMKIISRIRDRIRLFFQRREFSQRKRSKKLYALEDAKSIGVIFHAVHPPDYNAVDDLISKLCKEGKKMVSVGLVPHRNKPEHLVPKLNMHFFCPDDFSWNLKIKKQAIQQFVDEPFDILLDLTPSSLFFAKYLAGLSNARFKVGPYRADQTDFYDLMIEKKAEATLQEYIKHCLHYLQILKKPA